MRNMRGGLIAVLVLAAVGAYAAVPLVQQMLPVKGDVKSFSILSDSLQYGKGKDLTKIYNGAVELYVGKGVVDAARQLYQRKNDYVEVTIHTMKSDKAAVDFLKYWQKQNKVKTLSKTKTCTSFMVTKPSVMSYFVVGKFFTTAGAFYPAERATSDVKAFTTVIEQRILKLTKPAKGKRQ